MKTLTRQEALILLAIYQLKENAYLVTIREYLMKITGKNLSIGAVYVPLDRLHRLGYLDTRIGEPNARRGRNQIKYYRLNKKSFEALEEIKRVNEAMWRDFSEALYTV